jgi:hypothetical protein
VLLNDIGPGYRSRTTKTKFINEKFLAMLNWAKTVNYLKSPKFATMGLLLSQYINFDNDTLEWMHPAALAAKANSEDYPTWEEAMNSPLKSDW